MSAHRFRLPWRRGRHSGVGSAAPPPRRRTVPLRAGPNAVARARETVTEDLTAAGIPACSTFTDTAVLVVSELVTNVLRHATHSPVMAVGTTLDTEQLVITVSDADPRLPDLTPDRPGAGLRMVAELADAYDGDISAEQVWDRSGKIIRVRLRIPR